MTGEVIATLDELVDGLPDIYVPVVTAVWRHREGVRDIAELSEAVDTLFRAMNDLRTLDEHDAADLPDHPDNWGLCAAAWASVYWSEERGFDRPSDRGAFWKYMHAGDLGRALEFLVMLNNQTVDEIRRKHD